MIKARLLTLMALFLLGLVNYGYCKDTGSEAIELKLSRLERYIYGDTQSGNLQDRLGQIEQDLFGRITGRNAQKKSEYLHEFIFKGNNQSPSLDMKLSFLEWKLFNKTGVGNLETRLAELDKMIVGAVSMEPMAFRLEQAVHLTIENGLISLHSIIIPGGTEIKLQLARDISSRTAKKGDMVQMVISDDLFVDHNILALCRGGIVTARVKSVRKGGRFGRTGFINLKIDSIESMDATDLLVKISNPGQERFNKRSLGMAAGASTIGYLVMGPIGLAGGAFIKGSNIEVKAGTEIAVRTVKDTRVTGVLVHRK
jgi:hypothetical protein